MTRAIAVMRFLAGIASITALLSVGWLALWATVVPVVRGWSPVAIMSGSMDPAIATGDVVIAAPPGDDTLGPGAVIVFDNPASEGQITHRVVAVDPAGDYVTRGDANRRVDSTPVPADTIRGVGRILVPLIGTPLVWFGQREWGSLIIAAIATLAALWASRWAILARYNPWRGGPPAIQFSLQTIGDTLGVWPGDPPARPPPATRRPRRLAAPALVAALVMSLAIVAATMIEAEAAFTSSPDTTGSSFTLDTLDAPTSLTSTGTGPITLGWTATPDTYASGHRVYRANNPGGPYSQIAEVTPRATVTYDDIAPTGTHYYVVSAFYGSWESAFSSEDSATVTPSDDFDGVPAGVDNCPDTFNIDQFDTDGDGIGDACDPTPTEPSGALFVDSGQSLGPSDSFSVGLADFDSDGDLDAAYGNRNGEANTVWLNNGTGDLTFTGQDLGTENTRGLAIGDVDGDGHADIAYANNGGPNTIWIGYGNGKFLDGGQALGTAASQNAALGDVDGDGDLDLTYANAGQPNTVWLNNGSGTFTDSGQTLGTADSRSVAAGDVDGDGDLDLTYANAGQPNTVWLNNGSGTFTDSGQTLGTADSRGVAAGDVDGDGDLDLTYANRSSQPNTVWLNNGAGTFTDSGQTLGADDSQDLAFGDLDGDGDLDLASTSYRFATYGGQPDTIWINNGTGTFTDSGQTIGTANNVGLALGDLDGDGDLDIAYANNLAEPNDVWFNS